MEDFYINSTSQEESYDYSNITSDYSNITSDYSNITSDYSNIIFNSSNITSEYTNIMFNLSNIPLVSSNISDLSNFIYESSFFIFNYDFGNINSDYSNIIFNYSNITSDYSNNTVDFDYYKNAHFIMYVVTCIIIAVGLPLTLLAIYALYSLVRNDHVAPIYVINLLISDLIQLCCMIVEVARPKNQMLDYIVRHIHLLAVMASVGFMVCVALERYLVIACPLWYRFRRTIKISVVVCVLVWVLALVFVLILYFWFTFQAVRIIFGIFFLLPLPLFIFFLGGVLKPLSATRVPSDEKQRIVGILVLVLLIYSLLFLPAIIFYMTERNRKHFVLHKLSFMFAKLSPLADLTLYVFMRKGTIDKLLASACRCRTGQDSYDINSPSV